MLEAIFSDGTSAYLNPAEPDPGDELTVRIRAGRDSVRAIVLCLREGSRPQPDRALPWRILMEKERTEGRFDFYQAKLRIGNEPLFYYFEIQYEEWGEERLKYYDSVGLHDGEALDENASGPFLVVPGFHVPDWMKGAVLYQIFPDRFCNGNPGNDVQSGEYEYLKEPVEREEDWYKPPKVFDVRHFYGGDLEGVRQKLDYLQDLGVEVLYLNPIFVSPSNHKYDTQDYDAVDPHLTVIKKDDASYRTRTADRENLEESYRWFAAFAEEIHRRGMYLILDGVFNHCGSFGKWMDSEKIYETQGGYLPGALVSKDSPYREFFRFDDDETYDCWWDLPTLPKLNYDDSDALRKEIFRIAKKWVSAPYQADGWRLDVAEDLGHSKEVNHRFWKDFRAAVKEVSDQVLLVAEHYGSPKEWLISGEWDTVMNYDAFFDPVSWFFTGMEKHGDCYLEERRGNAAWFVRRIKEAMANLPAPSLYAAMNQLSNHDHSRFLTRTNRKVGRLKTLGSAAAGEGVDRRILMAAVLFQMTWPGAPSLYYGDEAGLCGFTDPDSRRTYPWGREDRELIEYHRDLIRIHRNSRALREGSLEVLCAEGALLAYGRFTDGEQAVVIINLEEERKNCRVPVWLLEVPEGALLTQLICATRGKSFTDSFEYQTGADGFIEAEVDPVTAILLLSERKRDERR